MDCKQAMAQVGSYLVAKSGDDDGQLAQALAHIAGCRSCLAALDAMETALGADLMSDVDALRGVSACTECQDALPGYIDAELNGTSLSPFYLRIRRHLSTCAACREEYADLRTMVIADRAGAFGPAPYYPTFQEEHRQGAGSLWEKISAHMRYLTVQIPIRIMAEGARFGELSPLLQMESAPVFALRKSPGSSGQAGAGQFEQWIGAADADNNVVPLFSSGSTTPGSATLVVKFGAIAPPAPIELATVSLLDKDNHLLEILATDADGIALFDGLAAGEYLLLIEHAGRTWRQSFLITA